jgi:hypothetical protein
MPGFRRKRRAKATREIIRLHLATTQNEIQREREGDTGCRDDRVYTLIGLSSLVLRRETREQRAEESGEKESRQREGDKQTISKERRRKGPPLIL